MKGNIRAMTQVGVCTAVLCLLSQISFPLPSGVPVTLQTLAVALCGCLLGARLGTLCVAGYLLLGAVGLPVFAGLGAGLAKLAGPTGGFLTGFLPMAALCGLGRNKKGAMPYLAMALGLILCHGAGVVQFSLVSGRGMAEGFWLASAPYLMKDSLSLVAARLLSTAIIKRLALVPRQPKD